MSKSSSKGRQSSDKGSARTPSRSTRFYDGPTVASKADDVKDKAKAAAAEISAKTKVQSRKVVATVKRHPWSIVSIITTIPFLLVISLASTIVCPPPTQTQSGLSKFFLTPLGLGHSSSQSSLHQTLCYPANLYHQEVLQPYVYPVLHDAQARATNHPVYKSGIEPGYQYIQDTSRKAWEGPIRPIADRISRGARRFYLTFIQPHLPYLKARFYSITAPYTSRVSAFHKSQISPRLTAAQNYANYAGKRSADGYNFVATHPLTGHAGRYAGKGYNLSRQKSGEAYVWARPHAIRYGNEARRIASDEVAPRAVRFAEWTYAQASKGLAIINSHVSSQYNAHLDPYLGPYIAKANAILAPHFNRFYAQVYLPYIRPTMEKILPAPLLRPDPPKSFWAMMADILPSPGTGHAAEQRGKMDGLYDAGAKAKAQASAAVSSGAEKVAKAASSATGKAKFDRKEMDRARDALKKRIEEQGQIGYDKVREQLLSFNREVLSDEKKFTLLAQNGRDEIQREIDYVMKGLDRLYSDSTKLTKEQVKASSEMADARVQKKANEIKTRFEKMRVKWHDQGKSIVKDGFDGLDALLGKEWTDLAEKMSWLDDVTPKDWTRYNTLKQATDSWKEKYMAMHKGTSKDKALSATDANINVALNELNTEMNDIFEGFRSRIGILKRTANDRIEAREAMAAADSSSSSRTARKPKASPDPGRVSILPIDEEQVGNVAGVGATYISKGKQQVMEALSAADAAASTEAAKEAARSALGKDKVESVIHLARDSASSIADDASTAAHQATRSVASAVGATPSPEGAKEHLESIVQAAGEGYASVTDKVEEVIGEAAETIKHAAGVSTTPEVKKSAESVYSKVSSDIDERASPATSLASEAGETASSLASSVGENAKTAASQASTSGSEAIRRAKKVVERDEL